MVARSGPGHSTGGIIKVYGENSELTQCDEVALLSDASAADDF